MPSTTQADLHERLLPLLQQLGLPPAHASQPLRGGANNRVHRIFAGAADLVWKEYYRSDGAGRRRTAQDFRMTQLLWEAGVRDVPEPLLHDERQSNNLFAYVDGTRLAAGDVGAAEVDLACAFFCALQRCARQPQAQELEPAQEACFTTPAHFATVDRRLARLRELGGGDELDAEARRFVGAALTPTWLAVRQRADALLAALPGAENPLCEWERCLSPSDFGFHNALRRADGGLTFFDFEYGGWDDPAKLVCDFFCQIQVPVPMQFFAAFARRVAAELQLADHHIDRMHALLPVHRLKWACLVLNEFLDEPMHRRSFAQPEVDPHQRKRAQLDKAAAILAQVRANPMV